MRLTNKALGMGLMAVALFGLLAGCAKSQASAADRSFDWAGGFVSTRQGGIEGVGVQAPDFTAEDVVTGEKVSLSQFKGKMVLLNFVNYGCSTQVNKDVSAQLLAIRQLAAQRNDFVPVSVFCGCCPEDTLKQFAQSNNLKWPWLLDADNSIVEEYSNYVGQYGYPTLVFVDKDQVIRDFAGSVSAADVASRLDNTSSPPAGQVQ